MTNQMQREAFTRGWENKWMMCEDGGIFEGPSGKHSERIGEVKVGDVICADAETFDPDNKIIWRLKEPSPGGWIYAPVRGPKTAVPLSEATAASAAAGHTYWRVTGKKGTYVRSGAELTSDLLSTIPKDSVCTIVEEKALADGKVRCRITEPAEGWVTQSCCHRWYKEVKV